MRVISTLLPAAPEEIVGDRPAILMAFDTLVDEKRLIVGITVGAMEGPHIDQVRLRPVGQAIVNRCADHLRRNYPQGLTIVAGVATVAGAVKRVRQVLTKAPDQSFVLLLCASDKVYDVALDAMCIDLKAVHK